MPVSPNSFIGTTLSCVSKSVPLVAKKNRHLAGFFAWRTGSGERADAGVQARFVPRGLVLVDNRIAGHRIDHGHRSLIGSLGFFLVAIFNGLHYLLDARAQQ